MKKKDLIKVLPFIVFVVAVITSVLYFLESFKLGDANIAKTGFDLAFGPKDNRELDFLKLLTFMAPVIAGLLIFFKHDKLGYAASLIVFVVGIVLIFLLDITTKVGILDVTIKINLAPLGIVAVVLNILTALGALLGVVINRK